MSLAGGGGWHRRAFFLYPGEFFIPSTSTKKSRTKILKSEDATFLAASLLAESTIEAISYLKITDTTAPPIIAIDKCKMGFAPVSANESYAWGKY